MRSQSTTETLETLCAELTSDNVALLLPLERSGAFDFTISLRYGKRPVFDNRFEFIRSNSIELVFKKSQRPAPLIVPLSFKPDLVLEFQSFAELTILRKQKFVALDNEDALIFALLSGFAQTAKINLYGGRKTIDVRLRGACGQQATTSLHQLQTSWLLGS